MPSNLDADFGDIPTGWLKQELFMTNRILAKATYYKLEDPIRSIMSEFLTTPMIPVNTTFYMDDVLARVTEVLEKFENIGLIRSLSYGDAAMQQTSIRFFVNKDQMRLYKSSLLKEIRARGWANDTDRDTEKLCHAAKSVLVDISYNHRKRLLSDIIERIVIYDSGQVEVRGCLPIFNQKVGYGTSDRDCGVAERGEEYVV